jgi:hypothetical protein
MYSKSRRLRKYDKIITREEAKKKKRNKKKPNILLVRFLAPCLAVWEWRARFI